MKFVRYATSDSPVARAGIIDSQDNIRDLSHLMTDIQADKLMVQQDVLLATDISLLPKVGQVDDFYLFSCVPRPPKIICLALNSKLHSQEMEQELPSEPLFFFKASSAICGAKDSIPYPKVGQQVDWEAELGVVIGRQGKHLAVERALDYVLGYCCFNDLSDRYWQFKPPGRQYAKGKSFDHFAPLGPYLVTKEEIVDPHHLHVTLKVNGELRQNFSTQDYIYSVQEAISFLSQFFTLEPGDLIAMGSGPGNAKQWNNQFLTVGDFVELEIEKLGRQQQLVVAES